MTVETNDPKEEEEELLFEELSPVQGTRTQWLMFPKYD